MDDIYTSALIGWYLIFGTIFIVGLILIIFGYRKIKKLKKEIKQIEPNKSQEIKFFKNDIIGSTIIVVIGAVIVIISLFAFLMPLLV